MATSNDNLEIFNKICLFLNEKNINFKSVQHEATFTSEESAKARGEDLSIGGKAIVMKVDNDFKLYVLSASKKLSSKCIKDYHKAKNIRFANKEELLQLTGLVPGSVPPFGKPILNFDLFVDESILSNEKIAFNAGSLTNSIVMNVGDYIAAAEPTRLRFSLD
jgi:Ala-tRNA(Pro) deacylase